MSQLPVRTQRARRAVRPYAGDGQPPERPDVSATAAAAHERPFSAPHRGLAKRRWLRVALAAVLVAMGFGFRTVVDHVRFSEQPHASRAPGVKFVPPPLLPPSTRYAAAVDIAAKDGMAVWVEADLVKRWRMGPSYLLEGVDIATGLARRPGVVGIKIADELGYHDGLTTQRQVQEFLSDTAAMIRSRLPHTKILVDMTVPQLGCLPGQLLRPRWATVCDAQTLGRYPQLSLGAVDSYVHSGDIDVLDVSSGLLSDRTYAGWGTDRVDAQQAAWAEIRHRGWNKSVEVDARKALAFPPGKAPDASEAAQQLYTFVDVPKESGATAVDIWTWGQFYQGAVYGIVASNADPGPLWRGICQRRADGDRLATHFTPSQVRVSVSADLSMISRCFSDVFVAAGTG